MQQCRMNKGEGVGTVLCVGGPFLCSASPQITKSTHYFPLPTQHNRTLPRDIVGSGIGGLCGTTLLARYGRGGSRAGMLLCFKWRAPGGKKSLEKKCTKRK
jgi:hypothetical protein